MAHDFLLEIGLEEMPAKVVTPSMNQLVEKTERFLVDNRLTFDSVEGFSTPRRLAVRVNGLAEKQADIEEEAKGPAKKIALDEEGNWSKAAQGFVRGQGLTPEAIFFKDIKGVEYAHVTKFIPGKSAAEVLAEMPSVIKSINFPVTMHWGSHDFKYIRPIHWLVALLDDEVVPFELLDVTTGRGSRGHRFLGDTTDITSASTYEEDLRAQSVIVDAAERKALISQQIATLNVENNFTIVLDEELLEEVNNLVEFPTAFVGKFDPKYLEIPEEVLVTSMKEHQRYFYVINEQGDLLPHFVSVRNGNDQHIENVIKGNEKVLLARLEDSEFFYRDDQKLTIADCVEKLKDVTFHEKIGSIYEKMMRVGKISQILGEKLGLSSVELADLERSASIYKFDLVTNMVGEFPELQGVMGEKYALMQGESPAVAQAIREHYLPISSEGTLPISTIGSVLAVADKLESVISFFNAGMIPTGSNDPYGLRRQTYGIVRIVAEKDWHFPLADLQGGIKEAINTSQDRFGIVLGENEEALRDFFNARLKQYLSSTATGHDIIDAVLGSESTDLRQMIEAASIIKEAAQKNDYKPSIEALSRVMNLAKKGQELLADRVTDQVDPTLFENEAETALYHAIQSLQEGANNQSLAASYQGLTALTPLIDAYFGDTMVMAEDPAVKANRLRTLYPIAKMARQFASLDQLIIK